MEDRTGQQMGNYRLVRQLGEGGFAEVYLGEHIHLGTQAAIKVLHTRLSREDHEHFRAEARTVAHLVHPHIVRVLEFGIENNVPFLVMDYAAGGTLSKLHPRRSRVPLANVRTYVAQIASALHYAHQHKVIHRDIKPENMLLNADHEAMLSDFGIALVSQSSRYQSTQDIAGTIAYMAPEQLQGKPRFASDQYALGIVVYEWLCGDRPFHGSFTELYSQHLFVEPPSFREKHAQFTPEIEQVVRTALAKDPAARFGSLEAFARAFEQACQLADAAALRPTFVAKKPLPISPVAPTAQPTIIPQTTPPALPPMQIAPSPVLPQTTPPALPPMQIAPSPMPLQTTPPALWPTQVAPSSSSPNLPQQQRVANVSMSAPTKAPSTPPFVEMPPQPEPHRFSRRIALRSSMVGVAGLAGGGALGIWWLSAHSAASPRHPSSSLATPTSHTPTPTSASLLLYTYRFGFNYDNVGDVLALASPIAWSPDGTRMASMSNVQNARGQYNNTSVQVWKTADGTDVYAYEGHTNLLSALAWSPDGQHIASSSDDGVSYGVSDNSTVQVWHATDGANPYIYRNHTSVVNAIAWSPNSQRIASASNDTTVQVWNATNGANRYIYQGHTDAVLSVAWSPDGKYIASAGRDNVVRVWDAANGTNLYIYKGHTEAVWSVAWSPDGKRLASASYDATVQVWDALNGANSYTYKGHTDIVYAVAWSPDGKRLASGSVDTTVQVWNATDGTHPFIYRGHVNAVKVVLWSSDGTRIASSSGDGTVQIWQAP